MSGARLDYVELGTGELGASKAFYEAALGLVFTDYGPSYAAAEEGATHLGLQGKRTEAPEWPLAIFHVEDLEAALGRVTAAGGEIVQPIFAFPGGRRFHFRDPGGNILGVWQRS